MICHDPIADYVIKGGVSYRVVADHLGSVRLVVRVADGVVVQRLAYDEFGRELLNTNAGFQPFGYAGGLADAQTTLVRFGARDYDAEAGRWTAREPLRFGGGINLYAYCGADPVNATDSRGLGVCRVFTALGEATVAENIALRTLFFIGRAVEPGYHGNM